MLYLAIDQHKAHLTINVRNEYGDVIQKAQISTKHNDIDDFFAKFTKKHEKFAASWPLLRSASENMYSND